MSLLDEMSEEFVMMNQAKVSDGEGGFITVWSQGPTFTMPQAHDTTIEGQKAEREGTASTYTFLPDDSKAFNYHDVFKRVKDGVYFRVTQPSGDKVTPAMASMHVTQIKAEKWELPT